jgi:hypothetical protein
LEALGPDENGHVPAQTARGEEIQMKDDRKRTPLAADYSHALGVATYCFAVCEWNAVWCCERIRPGTLQKLIEKKKTAGGIAIFFADLVTNMPPSTERDELKALADRFKNLVEVRNGILHGKPCTAPSGEQRLSSDGTIAEIADLEQAADDFAACSISLNYKLHGFLAKFKAR